MKRKASCLFCLVIVFYPWSNLEAAEIQWIWSDAKTYPVKFYMGKRHPEHLFYNWGFDRTFLRSIADSWNHSDTGRVYEVWEDCVLGDYIADPQYLNIGEPNDNCSSVSSWSTNQNNRSEIHFNYWSSELSGGSLENEVGKPPLGTVDPFFVSGVFQYPQDLTSGPGPLPVLLEMDVFINSQDYSWIDWRHEYDCKTDYWSDYEKSGLPEFQRIEHVLAVIFQ